MKTQGMTGKKTLLTLAIILVCSGLYGCSSVRNMMGFFRFWDSDKPGIALSGKDVNRLGFQMRSPKGNAEAHYNLGCYYQERDRHPEAIEEFLKAVSIDPTNVKALNRVGVSYDEIRDFPKAVASYEAAIKVNPTADYTYNNLAHSYRLQGRFEESIDTFKKALAINNQSTRIHNNLGLVYTMIGRHELARQEFELAIALAKPGAPIEQAQDKQEAPIADTAISRQNLKPVEDPFTRADLVQPNSTPVVRNVNSPATAVVPKGNIESPNTETLFAKTVNAPPAAKATLATVTTSSVPQPVATVDQATKAANVENASDVKKAVEIKKMTEAKKAEPHKIAEVNKVAEVRKGSDVKNIAEVRKPTEVIKAAEVRKPVEARKVVEIKKVAEVKKAVDVKVIKTVAVKKAVEVKNITAKAAPVKNMPVAKTTSMSLVIANNRADSTTTFAANSMSSDRFYAELARNIVQVRPVMLTPLRNWAANPVAKAWL